MSLSLVSSYSETTYPRMIDLHFEKFSDRDRLIAEVKADMRFAGINDYKILSDNQKIDIFFKDVEDETLFRAAYAKDREIELDYIRAANKKITNRRMESICKSFNRLIIDTPFTDKINFKVNRPEKTVMVIARRGVDFLVFNQFYNGDLSRAGVTEYYAAPQLSHKW